MKPRRWSTGALSAVILLLFADPIWKKCELDPDVEVEVTGQNIVASGCRYKYLVSISHPIFGHRCGGTLINSEYVLTAASCLVGMSEAKVLINGYHRKGDFEETAHIQSVINHPSYVKDNHPYDVALVKIKPKVKNNQPILEITNAEPSTGKTVAIIGWGRTGPQSAFSDVIQVRSDYKINPGACSDITVTNGFLCAGKKNVNICEGDLGGPLIVLGDNEGSDRQVGVISKAVGDCTRNGAPGLFVNVANIAQWIKNTAV